MVGNPAYEQGLVYVQIFAVLIFAGSPMSTLTAKFKGCLYLSFLAAALAACSSSQYHVVVLVLVVLVLVVPELLSEFEFFGFIGIPYVAIGLLRVNLG